MRRLALLAFALLASTSSALAEDDLTVLKPGPGETPAGKRLYTYLEAQAKTHFDARRKAVAALKTAEDVAKRQAELKAKFREALGELPVEKTPLNARVVGRDAREGYSVERVIYESRPGHHVTALFYLPEGKAPFPGVLVPCGHSANGKAAEAYQRISILLAKNGLAALCFDPIGQGERIQALDAAGKPAINGSTTEHTLLGGGSLLVGRSAAGYRFWDGVRSLDYLASRPEIDPARLGCTGNSGGGTETAYLMALDDRILAAAPSCFITSLERLFATIGPQDAEQNITGQVALGMEHADFITMRAPKPTLLSVGTKDFFDIRGSWDTYQEVKRIYCNLRRGECVDLFESDEEHGFTRPRRESCMRWMRRWLLGKDDLAVETDFPIAADKDVQCTKTGQVLSEFPGETSAFTMNAARAKELDRQRAEKFSGRTLEALRAEVRKRLAIPAPVSLIVDGHKNAVLRDGIRIDKWVLTTEPGVEVPVLFFRAEPPASSTRPTVVYIGADRALAAPGGPIEKRVIAGEAVAMIDPRGMGETTPGAANAGRSGVLGPDTKEAFLALGLNRPLLGQRVYDVLQALRAIEPTEGLKEFHVIGMGAGGPIALHVAALDDRVKVVEIERSLISWSAVARTPASRGQLASVVPGVLESYDLPDLAASLAPRALTIRAALDPSGKPVASATLDEAYARCKAAYKAASAADKLDLQAAP
jgi:cephalosporin-C deacetylase-like acetyl esterase